MIDPRSLQLLRSLGRPQVYERGQFIFVEGDAARALYVLDSGRVRLSCVHEEGRELTLSIIRPGDVFGEADAILCQARSCQAQAMRHDTRAIVIPWDGDGGPLGARPAYPALLRLMSERAVARDRRLVAIVCETAVGRVAAAINSLAETDGPIVIATHQQIADLAGSSREVATRIIGYFEQLGFLRRPRPHTLQVERPIDVRSAKARIREGRLHIGWRDF